MIEAFESQKKRNKLSEPLIEDFLDFVCSDELCIDVAYGYKNLRVTNDAISQAPNVIRTKGHSKIVSDYIQERNNNNLQVFSESTYFRILKSCKASFKQSMCGLDNILCDGLEAFKYLESLILYYKK